jgi:DNA-binding MarR family transcriptional regulator
MVSDLHSHLGYWMRAASNAVSHGFARRLETQGVTVAEWVVLRVLYDEEGLTPTALAERIGMTKGAISKLAERLVAKGLLRRTGNPDDRRAHTLTLTPDGWDKVPALAAIADENDAEFFAVLAEDERAALDRLLKSLVERRGLTAAPVD